MIHQQSSKEEDRVWKENTSKHKTFYNDRQVSRVH